MRKDGEDFLIAETKNGKKFYVAKDIDNNIPSKDITAETEYALDGINRSAETQPSRVGTELSTNIMTDNAENFNPNITKSEDIKNLSKKDMATIKREFKQSVEDLKAPKTKKQL